MPYSSRSTNAGVERIIGGSGEEGQGFRRRPRLDLCGLPGGQLDQAGDVAGDEFGWPEPCSSSRLGIRLADRQCWGLACLAASASYGVSYVYMDRYLARRGIPPLVLSAGQLIAATIELAIVLPFAGLQAVHWRWDAIAALAVLGALGTGIAYVLNYRLITDEGTTASVVTYLLPIVAVILGAAILGDHITAQIISGMLIVILGVAVTRRTREPSTR
jgi:threonine/homoserine efflux transporter RhtA